jgi:hypothetical protein
MTPVAILVAALQALAPMIPPAHAQDPCLDDDKKLRLEVKFPFGGLKGPKITPLDPPKTEGSGMTPVDPPKADGGGTGTTGRDPIVIDLRLFERRPWDPFADDPTLRERVRAMQAELEAWEDSEDPEDDPALEAQRRAVQDALKKYQTTAPGGTSREGGTSVDPFAVDELNRQRVRAWLQTWRVLKTQADVFRASGNPALEQFGEMLKDQAEKMADNPPAPLPEVKAPGAPSPLSFQGEMKNQSGTAGPGPGAMAALVSNPADASLLSSLALGLEAGPAAAAALDFRQAMSAQATLLQASSDPAEARLGGALKFLADAPGNRPTTSAAAPTTSAAGQVPSDGEAKPVEDWSYAAWFLWLGLGVDPDPAWQGVPTDPPRPQVQSVEETPPADSVLKDTETAPDLSPPDPRLDVWRAMRKTADSCEQHSDPNIRRLAPWLRWQAELLWDQGDVKAAPPPVTRVDPRTGDFEFTISLGQGDEDEDGVTIRPVVLLTSRLHVEAGGEHDFWPLVPYVSAMQQLAAAAQRDPRASQIMLQTRLLEPPSSQRSLDSWMSRSAWENAVKPLPAERSEGFDTSRLSPFTRSNVGLLSSTLTNAQCHKVLCTKPGCTHSEPDAPRRVAPAPGLDRGDWPAGEPQPLSIDRDEATR